MIGSYLGNFQIIRELGRGTTGAVYEARDPRLGRRVAVKVLHPQWAGDRRIARRFLNEARATSLVRHPGIAETYEYGRSRDGHVYLVMEYLDGESLRSRLRRRGRLDFAGVLLGRQIAAAMAAAHRCGVIHRDLKPANVMIVADPEAVGHERIKVLDFGLVQLSASGSAVDPDATQPDHVLGTPIYMSPEQCRGVTAVSDRADVYALGVILYEALSGAPPFPAPPGGAINPVLEKHIRQPPRPLHEVDPSIAIELSAWVQAMLSKSPVTRPSMGDTIAALDRFISQFTEPMLRLPERPGKLGRGGNRLTLGLALGGAAVTAVLYLVAGGLILPQRASGAQTAAVGTPRRPQSDEDLLQVCRAALQGGPAFTHHDRGAIPPLRPVLSVHQ